MILQPILSSLDIKYKNWREKTLNLFSLLYFFECILASLLLIFSIWWQKSLSIYNDTTSIHSSVGDSLFSIIPHLDLSYFYFGGIWIIALLGIFYAIYKEPKKIPLSITALSIFFIIRGICISSTHIGIPPDHIIPNIEGIGVLQFFRNDLFFSGHTGIPFLISLLVWKDIFWRNIFLIASVIMAFTVLSMRLHYSIDIIGAYFITYGVFHISEKLYEISSSFLVRYQAEKNRNKPPKNKNN